MSENTTYQQPTLLSADSLASLTVLPGSAEAQKMTVISGRNISALLTNSGPLGLFARTCLVSEQLFSTMCYLTWNLSSTPQSRLIFQLSHSELATDDTGTLLLPTPTAQLGGYQRLPGSQKIRHSLVGMARHNLWTDGHSETGGPLNPEWVEWLMGFPPGWTDLSR